MLAIQAYFRFQLQVENLNPPEPCGEMGCKESRLVPVWVNFYVLTAV